MTPKSKAKTAKRLRDRVAFLADMELSLEQQKLLDLIASGKPPRNSQAILKALEIKLAYAHGRPHQAMAVAVSNEESGPLEFRILDAAGAAFAFGGGDLPTRSIPLPTEVAE